MKYSVSNDELIRQIGQTQGHIEEHLICKSDIEAARKHLQYLRDEFITRCRTRELEGWEDDE